jgi:hypothetical protein
MLDDEWTQKYQNGILVRINPGHVQRVVAVIRARIETVTVEQEDEIQNLRGQSRVVSLDLHKSKCKNNR